MTEPPSPPALRGLLEVANRQTIAGWAADPGTPGGPVELELRVNGQPAGRLCADRFREDLRQAGVGEGRHGFQIHLPRGLAGAGSHEISLHRAADGVPLHGSPRTIPPDPAARETTQQFLADALDSAAANASREQLDALVTLLAERCAALLFARGTELPAPQAALVQRWSGAPAPVHSGPRALFIDEAVPDPARDAGSSAALSHMQALQRAGYRVDFVAAHGLEHQGPRSAALEALGITCWHAPWVGSVEEVLRRIGAGLDLAYLHRFGIAQRYQALVRRWCPGARLVYGVADLHWLRLARRQRVEAGLPPDDDAPLPEAASGLRTAELLAVLAADAVITHSRFEADLLRLQAPEASIHLVPWAVPPAPTAIPAAGRLGVAFVGSYGHPPNLDAAHVLISRVMPLVWAERPDIPCLLAGSDMPAALRDLAGRAAPGKIHVLGHVESLRTVWDQARLSAAPLRYGAGLKGKVLDSLAGGVPCLGLPAAAEGMEFSPELAPLLVSNEQDMAAAILRLHADPAATDALAAAGLRWIGERFAPGAIDAALKDALG
jgi:O-antigen biosynthesis protein